MKNHKNYIQESWWPFITHLSNDKSTILLQSHENNESQGKRMSPKINKSSIKGENRRKLTYGYLAVFNIDTEIGKSIFWEEIMQLT